MVRLLFLMAGMALVAILCLPGVSLGEPVMRGLVAANPSYVPPKRGPVQRDAMRPADVTTDTGQSALETAVTSRSLTAAGRTPELSVESSMPGMLGGVLANSFPDRGRTRVATSHSDRRASTTRNQSPASHGNLETRQAPIETDTSVSSLPASPESKYRNLEIEVSHSEHTFTLFGVYASGDKESLYYCKVGLGAREFPTPVGVYFVTHIYDKDPLWIPPPDRPWAWGQSPSNRVYGGTMAPLLKKRPVSSKNKYPLAEDAIAEEVRLDDYGYRFHGTNAPRSIGRNESHGCVRMLPKDAREVANLIKQYVGAPETRESENGSFVVLRAPVRLNLIK